MMLLVRLLLFVFECVPRSKRVDQIWHDAPLVEAVATRATRLARSRVEEVVLEKSKRKRRIIMISVVLWKEEDV